MKKALLILFCVLILLPASILGGCYAVVRYQYRDTYMPGLFVNSVYAANFTPQQLNDKLMEKTDVPDFVITDKEGKEYSFSLSEIAYKQDYLKELTALQESQSVLKFVNWFLEEGNSYQEQTLRPVSSYDKTVLEKYLDGVSYLKDNSDTKGKIVEVRKDSKGYYLYDETKNLLSHELAVKAIEEALDKSIYSIDLLEANCYMDVDHTSQMQAALDLWDELSAFLSCEITYEFGSASVVVDASKVSDFIAVDENGDFLYNEEEKLYLDEETVKTFIHEMAENYNTVGKPRSFYTTRGDTVTVETGTYGSKLDEKAELEYLIYAIARGKKETHQPIYSQSSYTGVGGTDDIGNTYIEVDLTNQTMYYYEDGKQKLETPVVTGNTSLGRGTPQKVCYVYYKQKNRVLRGEDYATPVKYWMAVYGNIGIHDASWRGKFGGTIYKTNGSHGCINTPKDAVSELYDMVEIGTPVIIFY